MDPKSEIWAMAHYIENKKTYMCKYAKGAVTTYQPISLSVSSLHPYQAMVTYRDMKAAGDWFGFAKMQIAMANSFFSWINTPSKSNGIPHFKSQKLITTLHEKDDLDEVNCLLD